MHTLTGGSGGRLRLHTLHAGDWRVREVLAFAYAARMHEEIFDAYATRMHVKVFDTDQTCNCMGMYCSSSTEESDLREARGWRDYSIATITS